MIKLCYNRRYLEEGDPDVEFKEELGQKIQSLREEKGLSRQAICGERRHFDNTAITAN